MSLEVKELRNLKKIQTTIGLDTAPVGVRLEENAPSVEGNVFVQYNTPRG